MKLSQWAKKQGISYVTAYNWFKAGKLPVKAYQTPTKTILVEEASIATKNNQVCIYCRVSSPKKKDDLERQAERCIAFAYARGYEVEVVIKEIASGLNDHRPKLLKLLDRNPSRILVEHKDRLTRFGFNYFEVLLPKMNCTLEVMNRDQEEKDDLMKDFIAIITSFCCRLYGLRRSQNKKTKLVSVLKDDSLN